MNKLWMVALILVLAGCGGNGAANNSVLIVGDSISLGYTPYVQTQGIDAEHAGPCFDSPYEVYKAADNNGEGSAHQAACIGKWLAGHHYAVVHFNAGIWDIDSCTPTLNTNLSDYLANLQIVLDAIRASGATPIFATTTPVSPTSGCVDNAEVVARNTAAVTLMQSQGVAIDDLYAAILPYRAADQLPSGLHFNDAGYQILAQKVVAAIVAAQN